MKQLMVVVGAVAMLGASVVAVHQWRALHGAREQNSALAARVSALELAQAMKPAAVPEPPPAAPQPEAAPEPAPAPRPETAPAPAPAAAAMQPARSDANPAAEAMRKAMTDPRARELTRSMMRRMLDQQYPDIDEALGMSADEARGFLDLLAQQQDQLSADSTGLFLDAASQDASTREAMQRRLAEQAAAQEAEQRRMLGSRYPRWEEYQGVAAARQEVRQLETTLRAAGQPLSQAQSSALETALAVEQSRIQREERDWMASPAAIASPNMMLEQVQRATESRERLADAAASHLNREQQEIHRRQVEQQVAMLRASMGMLGAAGGQEKP